MCLYSVHAYAWVHMCVHVLAEATGCHCVCLPQHLFTPCIEVGSHWTWISLGSKLALGVPCLSLWSPRVEGSCHTHLACIQPPPLCSKHFSHWAVGPAPLFMSNAYYREFDRFSQPTNKVSAAFVCFASGVIFTGSRWLLGSRLSELPLSCYL